MGKRPGAAALAAGALFALCCPTAVAVEGAPAGKPLPREVSGGYASWATADGELTGRGVSLDVTAPAVRSAGERAWFPADGGAADPETGAADVELGGAARLTGAAARPLLLSGLRLELDGDEGALYARTAAGGRSGELALAEVALSGAGPVVRTGGVTWAGLRASLTAEGAALLSAWSGDPFAAGDGLGVLDVTVGTGAGQPAAPQESGSPQPSPGGGQPQGAQQSGSAGSGADAQSAGSAAPTAAVELQALAPGGEQAVTGAGFAPGAVVLVAIDGDTRYQAVADADGRIAQRFPVYATAFEGEHTVELTAVSGEPAAVSAQFGVEASN
ncbi:HtaA domain-containing protein [Streptomyces sp. NPDC002328]|uniref:HtaA domain-containing protein n=1 Tax=Streptomyces sp. NPDC002328 TaxID=3364642 RepID=UPI0036C2504B